MIRYLLDTSVFSQPLKDHPVDAARTRWAHHGDQSVCTSAICLAEVLAGLHELESRKYWNRYRELLENRYIVLPLDEGVAEGFGQLQAMTRRQGRPRPLKDLLIAATARYHKLILATLNARDFDPVPGLTVEDWSQAQS